MELEEMIMEKDRELIKDYIKHLSNEQNSELSTALVYFLSQDKLDELIIRRKLFILKVLKENTYAGRFQIAKFPSAVAQKLIKAYKDEKAKEENAKQAHIAELVEEMNEIF